ncbi:MAG: START domain-containing protein [Saprospiraceae bacterium]
MTQKYSFALKNTRSVVLFLLIFMLSFSGKSYNEQVDWRFWKDNGGVRIYYAELPNSDIKSVKMKTTFDANLSTIVETLKDVDAYPKWVYKATYSKTVFEYNENDVIYYNYIDFPWPLQDRDIVVQSRVSQDFNTKIVTSVSFAKWDAVPIKKDVVRIQEFNAQWTFTPLANGKVDGEYVFRSNPGGAIPGWLVNFGLDEGPLKTISSLKAMLKEEKYINAKNGIRN